MFRVIALASLVALAGCHRQADAPGEAPTGLNVDPGDGQVTVSWNSQPGLTYWIFFRAGSTVTAPGVPLIFDAQSPRVVAPLANGTQYAFVMNATNQDSANWTSGAPLGSALQNLNGVAFGTVVVSGISTARLVAVGDAGTIFAGDYNYTNVIPPGVTAWTQATTIPVVSDLSAVMFSAQFIALGTDGSVLKSPDGNMWTAAAFVPSGGTRVNSLAFGTTTYVAVGDGGKIFTSPDLITWTTVSTTGNDLYNVSFQNGIFVATGANGTLLTSADASIWTAQTSNTPNALRGATYGTGSAVGASAQYVVVGDSGTIVTSANGTSWSATTLPGLPNLRAIRFGTRFVAVGQEVVVGQGAAVVYSDDAINWSPSSVPGSADLASIIFTPAMYLAVGAAGANAVSK